MRLLEYILNRLEFLTLFKSLALAFFHLRMGPVVMNLVPLSYVTHSC